MSPNYLRPCRVHIESMNKVISTAVCFVAALSFVLFFFPQPLLGASARIGVVLPLTGKLGHIGRIELNAIEQCLREMKDAGDGFAQGLELVVEDTASGKIFITEIFDRLVKENQVAALLGGCSSAVVWELGVLAEQHQVPFLVTTASEDRITEQGWKHVFRLCLPASEHLSSFGEFLSRRLRPKMVGIIREKSSFGRFGAFALARLFRSRHLKIRIIQTYSPGAECFQYALAKLDRPGLDLVCIVSRPREASLILEQMRAMELAPKMVLGFGNPFSTEAFFAHAWGNAQGVCTITPWVHSVRYSGVQQFTQGFISVYGRLPDYHAAQAYAGLQVLAHALHQAETLAPQDVRNALNAIEMETVYGPVRFASYAKKDRQNRPPSLLVQWIDDRPEVIWPPKLKTANFQRWK